jgi:hypothetical protein
MKAMGRDHCIFIVERSSITTVIDRVRHSVSKGAHFWGVMFEDAKLEWVTEKVVLRHMTRGAIGVESSGKDRLKRRRMSLNIELECRNIYFVSSGKL